MRGVLFLFVSIELKNSSNITEEIEDSKSKEDKSSEMDEESKSEEDESQTVSNQIELKNS